MHVQPEDRRRSEIVSGLADTLAKSHFRDWLDAEVFRKTLTAKFDVLCQQDRFDLVPLWDALAPAYNPQALCGLFLAFEREARRHRLEVRLPADLERLAPDERAAHLEHFLMASGATQRGADTSPLLSSEIQALPDVHATPDAAGGEPIPLGIEDIKPIISEDVRRRAVNAVVGALTSAPFGWRLDPKAVRDMLDSSFDALCDGDTFDLRPIAERLKQGRISATPPEIHAAVVRASTELAAVNIGLIEPELGLSTDEKERIRREVLGIAMATPASSPQKHVRIGELLVKYGILDAAKLATALAHQKKNGGRLGTNLVQLGMISASSLTHFLSVQLGIPAVGPSDSDAIGPEVLASIPVEIARKRRVVPIALEKRVVRLAMADPSDLPAIDEISFITGLRVQPAVAPEALISFALERFYFVESAERAPVAVAKPAMEPASMPMAPAEDESFEIVHVGSAAARGGGDQGIVLEERWQFFSSERADLKAEAESPEEDLAQALAQAWDRAGVERSLVERLSRDFARVVLVAREGEHFVVRRVHGIQGVDDARWPLDGCGVVCEMCTQWTVHAGALPVAHDACLSAIGLASGATALVMPLSENGRVVGAVVCSSRRSTADLTMEQERWTKLVPIADLGFQLTTIKARLLASKS